MTTAVKVLGKLLISVGCGILLFVAWTLWGTGIATSRAQDELTREYEQLPDFEPTPTPAAEEEDEAIQFVGPPDSFKPVPGDPVFRLIIPELDLSQMVVEGVQEEQLAKGPGHYPDCRTGFPRPYCTPVEEVWPGEEGRVIVSGHRTTHGAPFWGLDSLDPGDSIRFDTRWGDFRYEVTRSRVVSPNSTAIANPVVEGAEVVLTTCNPRFSAAERLVVFAEMVEAAP